MVAPAPPLSQPAGISRKRRFEATTRLRPKTETRALRASTRVSQLPSAMLPTAAAAHTVRAAPVNVDRNRPEMRLPTSAAARITRPTPPTSRTGRLPATSAAIDPRPRTPSRAVPQTDRLRRPAGSGRFLIADEICIRELRTEVPKRVTSTIRAPIAMERAIEPGAIGYSVGPVRASTGPAYSRLPPCRVRDRARPAIEPGTRPTAAATRL